MSLNHLQLIVIQSSSIILVTLQLCNFQDNLGHPMTNHLLCFRSHFNPLRSQLPNLDFHPETLTETEESGKIT